MTELNEKARFAFSDAVWTALKADANDLRKQQRIVKAFDDAIAAWNTRPTDELAEALQELLTSKNFSHEARGIWLQTNGKELLAALGKQEKQMVDVTQADRDAAAYFAEDHSSAFKIGGNDLAAIRNGACDDDNDLGAIVQAFAAHRIQSTADQKAKLDMAVGALDDIRATPNSLPLSGAVMRKIAVDALAAIKGE